MALPVWADINKLVERLGTDGWKVPAGEKTDMQRKTVAPNQVSKQLARVKLGRPLVHSEPWAKITVVMFERHAAYLDVMSVLMRMRHHRSISRTELIRAFVEFMERSPIDFSQFATMEQMVQYLVRHFRRIRNRGRLPLLLESSLFHPEHTASRTPVAVK